MNAIEVRTQLLAQHERLRHLLERCTRLAERHRAGAPVTSELDEKLAEELDEALGQLRDEFADHNQTETALIAELLQGPAAWGSLLVDRMLEEHVAEHAAFWALLSGPHADLAERIHELAEELDAHMAAEERTFLSPMTLRDDVIRTRTRALIDD